MIGVFYMAAGACMFSFLFFFIVLKEGKGILKKIILGSFCFAFLWGTYVLYDMVKEEQISLETAESESLGAADFYGYRLHIGEKIPAIFLTNNDNEYRMSYVGKNDKMKWLEIEVGDDKNKVVEVVYEKNRKKAEFERKKNVLNEDGKGYRLHYVLYVGGEKG